MIRDKTTFALFFGNRGFFPASLQRAARKEMRAALKQLGHKSIVLDPKATRYGDLSFYLGEGRFAADPIPNEFFGCAGVAEIPDLQKALQTIGYLGHRHHTSVTVGRYAEPVRDALARYLHYEVVGL